MLKLSVSELRIMELTTEETVTKLLSVNEVLHVKPKIPLISNPFETLGEFLKNVKPEPSPYEGKYVFIK